ncbi:Sodium channel and clathrin linker 1 [Operophtera brumata]|uniref:Sodium channel and clathrin linker 1 n=1 Tax=Operophtera brumata TaxID=104452 RepID=A0A0L7L3Q6_OPEBR|nr:Sodium channel and clathrin linker 1 [Operophtera brumata]
MDNTAVDTLQTEVEYYRQNQTVVEEEIRALITDNHKLSQQVGILLKEKLDNARQAHSQNDEQSKDIEELRKQKTIDALETELKTYTNYDNRGILNIHEERRDLDLKLQTALADYIELEAKYKELYTKHSTLENDQKVKDKEIASYKERGKEINDKIHELEKELEEFKINLAVEKKNSEGLQAQLSVLQKNIAERAKKESEAKSKVAEALQLYDLVCAQKNDAIKTIQEMRGEMSQLKLTLSNVRQDVETVCRKEVEDLKDKYNEKLTDMLQHIGNLDGELSEKGLLLNKFTRENNILQTINESYIKQQKENLETIDPKLAIAEQRTEAMFQELVTSERRNIQLVCEKQCLAIDIQRVQDMHAREIKRREWEESLLKNQCEELRIFGMLMFKFMIKWFPQKKRN